jgi:hypothetical protein
MALTDDDRRLEDDVARLMADVRRQWLDLRLRAVAAEQARDTATARLADWDKAEQAWAARLQQAESELAETQRKFQPLLRQVETLAAERDELRQKKMIGDAAVEYAAAQRIDAFRALLRAGEWFERREMDGRVVASCAWCKRDRDYTISHRGHRDDCRWLAAMEPTNDAP